MGQYPSAQPDEIIYVNFDELDHDVKHIVFCLNIAAGEIYYVDVKDEQGNTHREERRHPAPDNFMQVRDCFTRVLDSDRKFCLANMDLAYDQQRVSDGCIVACDGCADACDGCADVCGGCADVCDGCADACDGCTDTCD